jgi:hypothetical protein
VPLLPEKIFCARLIFSRSCKPCTGFAGVNSFAELLLPNGNTVYSRRGCPSLLRLQAGIPKSNKSLQIIEILQKDWSSLSNKNVAWGSIGLLSIRGRGSGK